MCDCLTIHAHSSWYNQTTAIKFLELIVAMIIWVSEEIITTIIAALVYVMRLQKKLTNIYLYTGTKQEYLGSTG